MRGRTGERLPYMKPWYIKSLSQKLRKEATKEENRLWYGFLKTYPVQFRRQVPFDRYILDFYCAKARLAVELDGCQHYEGDGPEYDYIRTEYLGQCYGIRVIRFTNEEIRQEFRRVCGLIDGEVKRSLPPAGGKMSPPKAVTDEGAKGGSLYKEHTMKTVTIYTDGACSGNPGPGGWGAILMYGEHKKEMSGGAERTTNNRMELTGVITALEALKEPCVVELYSDSKYVIDALEKGWARGWKARGRVKSDKKPALNPDLWEKLLALCEKHTVKLHWVKGHAENEFNNRCDELAVAESRKFKG